MKNSSFSRCFSSWVSKIVTPTRRQNIFHRWSVVSDASLHTLSCGPYGQMCASLQGQPDTGLGVRLGKPRYRSGPSAGLLPWGQSEGTGRRASSPDQAPAKPRDAGSLPALGPCELKDRSRRIRSDFSLRKQERYAHPSRGGRHDAAGQQLHRSPPPKDLGVCSQS